MNKSTSGHRAAAAYLQRFPDISLRLHPERIADHEVSIERRQFTSPAELGEFYTAFRATHHRVEAALANPFARPLKVKELVARIDEHCDVVRTSFLSMRDYFIAEGKHQRIEVPAYDLGSEGYLLLDGNHRTTGLYMAGVPFTLTLSVLKAPVDRRNLIDLKYWDGGLNRFFNRIRRGTSEDTTRPACRFP
jgi:hypothetical protein